MKTEGLSLDQAPPLFVIAIPLAIAPLFSVALGLLFLVSAAPSGPESPTALASAHLLAFGSLGQVVTASALQLLPVLGGERVRVARLGYLVSFLLGGATLLFGFAALTSMLLAIPVGATAAATGFALFLAACFPPLARALGKAREPALACLFVALVSLTLVASIGLVGSTGFAGATLPWARNHGWLAHVSLALLGFFGTLVLGMTSRLFPMFYLSAEPKPQESKFLLGLAATAIPAALALLLCGRYAPSFPASLLTLALFSVSATAIWILHPLKSILLLLGARRSRPDATRSGVLAALLFGMLGFSLACAALLSDSPRLGLAAGFCLLEGWAGLLVHSVQLRVFPFLVWFHWLSPHVGLHPVPAVRGLLPDKTARRGLLLHGTSILVGAAALLAESRMLFALSGVLLVLRGLSLFDAQLRALRTAGLARPTTSPALAQPN